MQGNKQQQLARMERSESGKYATPHCFLPYTVLFATEKPGLSLNIKPVFDVYIMRSSCVGPTQQQGRLSCRGFDPINVKKKLYTLIPTALQRAEREQDGRGEDCRLDRR